jgi:hypothetical protein
VKAETLCEAKARRPLASPKRIDARRAEKVTWGDPAMRMKLASAYAQAEGDDEKAARILGVSLGSARLARRRHLDCEVPSSHRQNGVEAAGTALCVQGTSHTQLMSASVTCCWAAFRDRQCQLCPLQRGAPASPYRRQCAGARRARQTETKILVRARLPTIFVEPGDTGSRGRGLLPQKVPIPEASDNEHYRG